MPYLVEEVAYLELIAHNKRKQNIIKHSQRIRIIYLDNMFIYTTKEQVFNTKKSKLNEFLSLGLALTHATLDK